MTDLPHQVEADGYCPFCETVGCRLQPDRTPRRGPSPTQRQLDRLELKTNRIMRHLGLDPDAASDPAPEDLAQEHRS